MRSMVTMQHTQTQQPRSSFSRFAARSSMQDSPASFALCGSHLRLSVCFCSVWLRCFSGLAGHIAKFCPETIVCRKCGGPHAQKDCPDLNRVRMFEDENDTVYIQGLPTTITEEELVALFASIGLVRMVAGKGKERFTKKPKVWIYKDKSTGQPKGDATFTYEDPAAAPAAVKWFNGQEYKGRKLIVALADKKEEPEGGFPSAGGYGGRGGYGGGRGGGRSYGGQKRTPRFHERVACVCSMSHSRFVPFVVLVLVCRR